MRAKEAGSTRFCMGSAWRGPSQVRCRRAPRACAPAACGAAHGQRAGRTGARPRHAPTHNSWLGRAQVGKGQFGRVLEMVSRIRGLGMEVRRAGAGARRPGLRRPAPRPAPGPAPARGLPRTTSRCCVAGRPCLPARVGALPRGPRALGPVFPPHPRRRPPPLQVCTTLGMLTPDQAAQLREAGLTAYNHNLDTSPGV